MWIKRRYNHLITWWFIERKLFDVLLRILDILKVSWCSYLCSMLIKYQIRTGLNGHTDICFYDPVGNLHWPTFIFWRLTQTLNITTTYLILTLTLTSNQAVTWTFSDLHGEGQHLVLTNEYVNRFWAPQCGTHKQRTIIGYCGIAALSHLIFPDLCLNSLYIEPYIFSHTVVLHFMANHIS